MSRTVGDARKGQIEVRYQDQDGPTELDKGEVFDEIVANGATVHLEKMGPSEFCLIVETPKERAQFSLFTAFKYQRLACREVERESINRRSEGQRRRWNALTPTQRKRRKR